MERREFLTKSALTAAALPLAISSVGANETPADANPSGYKTRERFRPAVGFDWKPGPSNEPVGEAKGIFPGRVVMTRYPEAARWPGKWKEEKDQWWLDQYTDRDKCEEMVSTALQSLTGATADVDAWDKIFRHFNSTTRKLDRGYEKGEVVAVKINLNNSGTRKKDNLCDATPQMVLAVVRQLVNQAGVPEENVLVYDVKRQFFSAMLTTLWSEFPNIRILQDGAARREQPRNPAREIESAHWVEGVEFSAGRFREAKLVAKQVLDAEYIVNLAMLKLHSYPYNYMEDGDEGQTAITMISKNHAGSIRGTAEMHEYLNTKQKGTKDAYNPLVDLCASPALGGKTLICLLDGLYCGRKWRSYPQHFPNAPFNNRTIPYENPEWPACFLASFDQVAIQAVGLDILYSQSLNNEEPAYHNVPRILIRDNADDLLREMATPYDAPSGVVYRQGGEPIPSLGVFEHWDNDESRQYSRNLDPENGQGIEFVYIPMGSARQA